MKPSDSPRIGLIAGSGQFPLLFAQGARQAGYEVVAVGFEGETDPELASHTAEFHWLKLGQLNKLIKTFRNAGVERAAMTGAISKTKLFAKIRPDWRAFKLLHNLRNKKDDFLLRALARELESEGIRIEPSTLFLPSLLATEGTFTRRRPTNAELRDIQFGWKMAKAIGRLDIGQCLVVRHQAVLAVEGIDGTDATILRGGRLCKKGAVIIKVSKPSQDLRFDVPAVGLETIATMESVKARVLVIEADKTLMFDREAMIKEANRAGITIIARADEAELPAEANDSPDPETSRSKPDPQPARPEAHRQTVRSLEPDAVKVGVIGVGYLGRFHAQKYQLLPNARLVGVVDIDRDRARAVAAELDTTPFYRYRELLNQVDAVSVVTPTPSHYSIARECLEMGVHVLLEKPMTESAEHAGALAELAARHDRILQIGHLERFNPAFRAIEPEIKEPMFIEAHRLALFTERGLEVNVILDLMIHDIDIVLHSVKQPLAAIHASGVPVLTGLPDIANARLDFANGATANLTASRISVKNMRRIRIFQENCYLVADYGKRQAFMFRKEDGVDDAGYPEISAQEVEVEQRDALEDEIDAFLESIRTGAPPVVDGNQGEQALGVALEISRQITDKIKPL